MGVCYAMCILGTGRPDLPGGTLWESGRGKGFVSVGSGGTAEERTRICSTWCFQCDQSCCAYGGLVSLTSSAALAPERPLRFLRLTSEDSSEMNLLWGVARVM